MKIAEQICEVLTKAGIPAHKQRQHVAALLNLSYPSARRLLIGETQWTEKEITTVLAKMGLEWDGLCITPKCTTEKAHRKIFFVDCHQDNKDNQGYRERGPDRRQSPTG